MSNSKDTFGVTYSSMRIYLYKAKTASKYDCSCIVNLRPGLILLTSVKFSNLNELYNEFKP